MNSLNYRHLYYFWMVAKEGSMARAAQRLDMAIQTISVQVRELEKSLGHQLFKPDEQMKSSRSGKKFLVKWPMLPVVQASGYRSACRMACPSWQHTPCWALCCKHLACD